MSFRALIERFNQLTKDAITLDEDYQGKHKGSIYMERKFHLKRKASKLRWDIENYGKGTVFKWSGVVDIKDENNIIISRDFNVILYDSKTGDVIEFIEYKTKGTVTSINKEAINLGTINPSK